jgi:hypothetical protein
MAAAVTRIIERLIDDDYLREQLSAGAQRLGAAYRRGRKLRGSEALQDQKLHDHVRAGAEALAKAGRRVTGKPPPEPPRSRRRLPALLILGGVAAFARSMHRAQQAAVPWPAGSPAARY